MIVDPMPTSTNPQGTIMITIMNITLTIMIMITIITTITIMTTIIIMIMGGTGGTVAIGAMA